MPCKINIELQYSSRKFGLVKSTKHCSSLPIRLLIVGDQFLHLFEPCHDVRELVAVQQTYTAIL